jgi:hypothetical protein
VGAARSRLERKQLMLDLSQFLTEVRSWRPRLAVALQNIQDAINQTALSAGVDSTQHGAAPASPQSVNIAAGSDHLHVTIQDDSQRSRALRYFIEWSVNDSSFRNPHLEDLGTSRGRMLALPAKDGEAATISYYVRVYSSYLSSKTPSTKLAYGGNVSPTAITLSGTSQLTPLSSTGGGTENSNGQNVYGFGRPQFAQPRAGSPVIP